MANVFGVASSRKLLEEQGYGLAVDVRCSPRWAQAHSYEEPDCKLIQGRLLLSQLGYLAPHNRDSLFIVDQSPSFFQALKSLDLQPEYVAATFQRIHGVMPKIHIIIS